MDHETEQKLRAEISALKLEVARLQTGSEPPLVGRAPFAVQCYDREGFATYLNEAMVALLGLPSPDVAVGKFNIYRSDEMRASGMAECSERALRGEFVELPAIKVELANFDDSWQLGNTGTVWYHQIWFPRKNGQGEIVGTATFVWDVTERQESQESQLAAQRHENLGVLAGGIAHDFNNLLTGVLGMASLALEESNVDIIRDHLRVLRDAAEQAGLLTKQLLAYAGKGQFIVREFDPGHSLREMSPLLTLGLPSKVSFEASIDSEPCLINADETQFRQVVFNVVRNAIEALEEGGVVRISGKPRDVTVDEGKRFQTTPISAGRYFEFVVKDSGVGMSENTQSKMFTPFYSKKAHGHGLGLAAVLGIIRNHRGGIQVQSVPKEGTQIAVLFPCRDFEELQSSANDSVEIRRHQTAIVLVIDDEASVRVVIEATLRYAGYDVLSMESGQEGVECFRQNQAEIALVILDLTMPEMDGAEVLKALRTISPSVQVLLTSGFSEDDTKDKFVGMTFAGFIQKPFRAKQLIQHVESLLTAL